MAENPAQIKKAGMKFIEDTLKEIEAEDVIMPRSQVELININDSFEEIIETITQGGHSRFPVYQDRIDNIVGVLYAKSLLGLIKDDKTRKKFIIKDHLNKPMIISENKKLNELLKEFINTHVHMAIVVNEYGSMLGIVTLEDILEEIFGEITDEFDQEAAPHTISLSKEESVIKPSMTIEEFNTLFNTRIKNETFETIGGFIIDGFGYVPRKGERLSYNHYSFEIMNVAGSRIQKIKVTRE